jgi:hypothetical protein
MAFFGNSLPDGADVAHSHLLALAAFAKDRFRMEATPIGGMDCRKLCGIGCTFAMPMVPD